MLESRSKIMYVRLANEHPYCFIMPIAVGRWAKSFGTLVLSVSNTSLCAEMSRHDIVAWPATTVDGYSST